jgi:SNF2 family DNA or RNA helicase
MKVSTAEKFQMVYTVLNHEYLGYLMEAFVVQLDTKNALTLAYQQVSSKNIREFRSGIDDTDIQIVKLIDSMQQETIFQKFGGPKKKTIVDFFLKVFDVQKGDKLLQEAIGNYIQQIKSQLMPLLLQRKRLFVMGNDGNPIRQEIQVMPQKATVLFHFYRNEQNTHYFPTIKYEDEKVDFQFKNAYILSEEPAWLVVSGRLYHFDKDVDGKKLKPFLNKKFIEIPKKLEDDYYRKFIKNIIMLFDVYAKGFEIQSESFECIPQLTVSEQRVQNLQNTLFDETPASDENPISNLVLTLSFRYGKYTFRFDSFSASANVSMEKRGDDYIFHKVRRDLRLEREKVLYLRSLGIDLRSGRLVLDKTQAFSLLQRHYQLLREAGFELDQQNTDDSKRYFLGYSRIEININEKQDWFDIEAIVHFGEFRISFMQLRTLILAKKREFILPNGETAVIPEAWFGQYSELFAFAEPTDNHTQYVLRKHHLALVQELHQESLVNAVMSRKLESLRRFEGIEPYPLAVNFVGTLRPYQKSGYDWMRFLADYQLGGCLADDMGLGKTAQTLALLAAQHEANPGTSLVVMPTSLLYNWELEAQKFAPQLRIFTYTGTYRDKNMDAFAQYDVVLTSYGIVRIDVDLMKNFVFNYIVLDESQAIKNPQSNITKAVTQLQAKHRLVLTGTPLENSTMDLWSQMNFINPGLLGSQSFFRNEFQLPIEKKNDEEKLQKLYRLIKPFMLRRHKSQVATELPPKVESVHFSQMTEQQAHEYEEAKSYYRNLILQHIENEGIAKSQMIVLQGLTKLRQIANHPRMTQGDYEGDSGKLGDVLQKLEIIIEEGHKVLIFSQFVKHLDLFREHLDSRQTDYAYLDGSTYDRQSEVEKFQQNESVRIFLISLKAGGLGLNLTAADYVFILDPWWNPAIEQQAIDRAHRIGQLNTVFTYKFIAKDTVEEKILVLQQQKKRLANDLITTEESFVKSLSREDVMALLT